MTYRNQAKIYLKNRAVDQPGRQKLLYITGYFTA